MIASLFAVLAAAAVAVVIIDRPGRRRALAMLIAAVLAPALIAADQWQATQVMELRTSLGLLLAAVTVVAVLAAAGATVMRRWPVMLPVLILLALPFRVPITVGGEEANLLMPLYLVMASGVLATLWREFRAPGTEPGSASPSGIAAWLRPLLAAAVVLYALGLFYSDDRSAGLQELCFFLVPFGIVFALVTEIEWTGHIRRVAMIVILGLGLLCAVIGFVEWGTHSLLWNEAVTRSNDFHVYFRVNSLFWDPNVYGRYLALAITITAAVLLWARQPRVILTLAVAAVLLWFALISTYSQSSFIALLAGLTVLLALRWSLKYVFAGVGIVAVATILFGSFAGDLVKLDLGALNKQTSGRANLVEGGIDLFEKRPVHGYGPGSFSVAFKREIAGPDAPVTESHTEPVTVAAEQGLIGLAVYFGLMVTALAALATGMRATMPGLGGSSTNAVNRRGPPAARAAVLAAFIGVLVHTVTYAGFLTDPVTWVLIAVGYSLALPCRATSAV